MTRPARLLIASLAALLSSCVVVPRTTEVYDRECRISAKKMVLEGVQIASIHSCANEGCLTLIAAAGVVAAGSAVISGSIVIAGNVIYWLEKQGNCRKVPLPPPPSPGSAP